MPGLAGCSSTLKAARGLVDNPRVGKQRAEFILCPVADLFHHRLGHTLLGGNLPLGKAVNTGGDHNTPLPLRQRIQRAWRTMRLVVQESVGSCRVVEV